MSHGGGSSKIVSIVQNFAERIMIELDVTGHLVKVLSPEDLIHTKRAAGRPKDIAVLPTLEATLQMQRELGQF